MLYGLLFWLVVIGASLLAAIAYRTGLLDFFWQRLMPLVIVTLPKCSYVPFLVSGFGLGIAAYQMVLFWCTQEKIYCHFAVTLFFYIAGVNYSAGIWSLPCCSTDAVALVLDTFNLVLFASFIKQFLLAFVDFKRLHPRLVLAIDSYIVFGVLLILFYLVFPHPIFYTLRSLLIIVSALTGPLTVRYWYATFKNLQAFSYLNMIFFLLNVYLFSQKLFFGNQVLPLPYYWLCIFVASVLFVEFSTLISQRIALDRKQREMEQRAEVVSLKKYQLLYQNAVNGLFTVDADGYLQNSNKALQKLLGLSPFTPSVKPPFLPGYFFDPETSWNQVLRHLALHGPIEGMEIKGNQDAWYSLTAQRFGDKDTGQIEGSLTDISRRKHQEIQLDYLARHDVLTLLHNRNEFESFLQDALHSGGGHTLLFIDLDNFKVINDLCGHRAGDRCLQEVAALLKRHVGKQDMLARLGGDEFGVVFWDQDLAGGKTKAQSIRIALDNHFFQWQQRLFKTTASLGVVAINEQINCGAEAMSLADAACYQAKAAGRNQIAVHETAKHEALQRQNRMAMISAVTQAIQHNQLSLYYQPVVALDGVAAVRHIEAWVCMDGDRELLLAKSFLPVAQRYNLVADLDRWAFNTICGRLNAMGLPSIDRVNINISPQTLNDPQFVDFVQKQMTAFAVAPDRLCFEINENFMLGHFSQGLSNISQLRELGFRFVLDNFGAGFASIEQIKRLPVDFVKIDGQFIRHLKKDVTDQMLVQALTDIAHSLGKQVIAGYVEDEETVRLLRDYHIDFAQGNYYGAPEPITVEDWTAQELKNSYC